MSTKYYSQREQDKFINEVIFTNKKCDYFIDIGAHDGVSINNTFFLKSTMNGTEYVLNLTP